MVRAEKVDRINAAVGELQAAMDAQAAQIAALRIPCLVCGTREDLIHPFAMAEGLASLISGARFVELLPKGRDRTAHFASLRAAMDEFVAGLAG